MKRFLLAVVMCFLTTPAFANGWYWVPHSSGYYIRTNYVDNDGFLYSRTGCCGHYNYVQVKAIPTVVQYSKGWQEAMANATYAFQDRQAFLESQRALLSAGGYNTSNYLSQETIQSGVYPLGYSQDDGNYLAHAAERVSLRVTDSANQLGAKLIEAAELDSESRAQALGLQAYMAFLNSPKTVTRTFSQQSSTTNGTGAVSALGNTNIGQQLATIRCSKCHGGANAKNGLDLSSLASYGAEDRKAIRAEAVAQMQSGEMPEGGPKLPDWEIAAIAEWIWPTEEPQVRTYKAKSQPQTQAEEKQ